MLAFAAGAAVLLAMEAIGRRKGGHAGAGARALLARMRPKPVADDTVELRVRKKLARTASDPAAIVVFIEHGCADLRGPVETRERARLVRAVSTVRGVDSVLDLMTEPTSSASAR
ncbi:MAG: hypothetical protein NVS3B10_20640 [Polyangiales bacterium]